MIWKPDNGFIPRGYTGATSTLADVRLVICLAEPGNPGPSESYEVTDTSIVIDHIVSGVESAIKTKCSPFHKNLHFVLEKCWPGLEISEQLSRTWITETTLCSAPRTTGPIHRLIEKECIDRYLKPQLKLFPNAFLLALGKKAESRLLRAELQPHFTARAAGMPIGKRVLAEDSWRDAGKAFRAFLDKTSA